MLIGSYEKYGWLPLLRRKIKSLYLPMVLWGAIGLIMFFPIRILIHDAIPTVTDFLKLPLMVLSAGGGHFWYVRALIIIFALAPIIYYVAKNVWVTTLCIVGALMIPQNSVAAYMHVPVAVVFTLLGTQLAIRGPVYFKRSETLLSICIVGVILSFRFKEQLTTHLFLVLFEPAFMIGVLWFGYDTLDKIHK